MATHNKHPTITHDGEANLPDPDRLQPDQASWMKIVAHDREGTMLLPQAHFAQGVLIAESIVDKSLATAVPVSQFFLQDPPKDMLDTRLTASKVAMHEYYDIKTTPSMISGGPIHNVWDTDRGNAQAFLITMAEVVGIARHETVTEIPERDSWHLHVHVTNEDARMLNEARDDPLFRGLVHAAAAGLRSDGVAQISAAYIAEIVAFMKKYTEFGPLHYDDAVYRADRSSLHDSMTLRVAEAAGIAKSNMLDWANTHAFDLPLLYRVISTISTSDLFHSLDVALPHPLKNPDYE